MENSDTHYLLPIFVMRELLKCDKLNCLCSYKLSALTIILASLLISVGIK